MTDRSTGQQQEGAAGDKAGVTEATASAPAEPMLKQAAYEGIVALLNQGALKPGQMVSQRALVEMTGSTLGSIREAISRLEADGLLQTLPKRGLMVPSLDVAFVRDAYQLRRILETNAMPHAVERLPASTIRQWLTQHEDFLLRVKSSSSQALADEIQTLDWSMHAAMIDAMQNALIANVYRVTAIKIHMVVQSRLQLTPFNAQRVIGEHLAFLRPMAEGDAPLAVAAIGQHIDNSLTLALGGSL